MKLVLAIFYVTLSLLLMSCGTESDVKAPQHSVVAEELQVFPPEDWRLLNVRFFMWQEEMTSQHGKRALEISEALDALDLRAIPFNRESLQLESRITPLKEKSRLLKSEFRSLRRLHSGLERKIKKLSKDIKEAKDSVQAAEPDIQAQMREKLARFEGEFSASEEQLKDITEIKESVDLAVEELEKESDALELELNEIRMKQFELSEQGRELTAEIIDIVEWPKNQPTSVVFQFKEDGSIYGSVSGWNLDDGEGDRNFYTEAPEGRQPTMANVRYTPLGGIFEFDLLIFEDPDQSQLRETYSFRFSRTKLNQNDGRKYFSGEIVRTKTVDGKTITRRGVAKLADKNN